MAAVHQYAERNKERAAATGKSIYDVSVKVDQLRKETIGAIPQLTRIQRLRIAQTEHLSQRWWLYNALMNYHELQKEELTDGGKYRLEDIFSSSDYRSIEPVHRQFHVLVEQLIDSIHRGELKDTNKLLRDLDEKLEQIIHFLHCNEREYPYM